MNFESFTPLTATLGGILIGLASLLLLLTLGRMGGISGIAGGVFRFDRQDIGWRLVFILGLIAGPAAFAMVQGKGIESLPFTLTANPVVLIIAGLLVGFGTRLGSGCTSGHGICGLSRFSLRSLISVATFVGVGILTVTLARVGGLS